MSFVTIFCLVFINFFIDFLKCLQNLLLCLSWNRENVLKHRCFQNLRTRYYKVDNSKVISHISSIFEKKIHKLPKTTYVPALQKVILWLFPPQTWKLIFVLFSSGNNCVNFLWTFELSTNCSDSKHRAVKYKVIY